MPPKKMRAMMFLEPQKLELQEIPVPETGPGEILVKVRAATTCGTDVKSYLRGYHLLSPPCPFGHEFSGDVAGVGPDVKNFRPGMRIVAHNSAPCCHCFFCKHGQHNLCENLLFNFGTYAEYIKVPAPIVSLNTFQIPDRLTYAEASIMEPLVSVVHGQRLLNIQPGEHVALIGAGGPIGLMHLQMAERSGAAQIIAVDLSDTRLGVARNLGANVTINPRSEEPVKAIKDLTGGRGVDVAIECAGSLQAWQTAVDSVRKGGRVEWFGGLKGDKPIELDTRWIHYGELTLHGTFHGTPLDVHRAFELISSGVIDVKSLISDELPLERVEEALKMVIEGEVIKIAINPELADA
jgi:L-iditol 2-dehydrogenase